MRANFRPMWVLLMLSLPILALAQNETMGSAFPFDYRRHWQQQTNCQAQLGHAQHVLAKLYPKQWHEVLEFRGFNMSVENFLSMHLKMYDIRSHVNDKKEISFLFDRLRQSLNFDANTLKAGDIIVEIVLGNFKHVPLLDHLDDVRGSLYNFFHMGDELVWALASGAKLDAVTVFGSWFISFLRKTNTAEKRNTNIKGTVYALHEKNQDYPGLVSFKVSVLGFNSKGQGTIYSFPNEKSQRFEYFTNHRFPVNEDAYGKFNEISDNTFKLRMVLSVPLCDQKNVLVPLV